MKRKPKILIIEDNTYNRDLFHDVFEQKGFKVTMRENAEGAFVEEVSTLAPDIISMDLMLGKDSVPTHYDGFEALKVLKTDPRTQRIPVIILTSFFEEKKVQQAKEAGAVDFISIPGQSFTKIPDHFLRYLRDPKRYKSSHSVFRK